MSTQQHFAVGEIAIAHNWQLQCAQYNGSEVQVIGALDYRKAKDVIGQVEEFLCYEVRAHDGTLFRVGPDHLRKRKDPGVASWSELRDVWQPNPETCSRG